MKTPKLINVTLLAILSFLAGFTVNAQNLPNKQKSGLRAPVGIRIDGNATEWNNQFQAYNRATGIFYSMANDNDNLYLAVQATDQLIIRKIMNGGITLKIDTGGKKNSGVAIIYPIFARNDRPLINLKDKPTDATKLDSLINVVNKRFAEKSKEIKIQGIKLIPDSLISIYNQDDIKVAALFDHAAAYTYELAIPLKYIGMQDAKASKFNYTIMLSGSPQIDGINIIPATRAHVAVMNIAVGAGAPSIPTKGEADILSNPTDFDGVFTLAVQ
jgi:hypothetical protein